MISKGIEYANSTTLMCFGAEGWRDHLEREWEELLANFDFDGLYIDHWFHTRMCANPRHGCGGYLARFVTEGYHDFAKRARRVVARHTGGQGILLLNANMLLFSGVVPWFDIRLNGENNDPRFLPTEAVMTTWNGRGQGVQSLAIWRSRQDSLEMINFCTAFMFPHRFRPLPKTLADWTTPGRRPALDLTRYLWDTWRFFGLNRARRVSSFDSHGVIDMSEPGSLANAFARDGRVLVVMAVLQTGKNREGMSGLTRRETLRIISPEALGLRPETRYRIVDLKRNRFLDDKTYSTRDLSRVSVTLLVREPSIIVIEPEAQAPRLVFFAGANEVSTQQSGRRLVFKVKAAEGSPLTLHVDTGGFSYQSLTTGIERESAAGDFAVFSGAIPSDGLVVLSR
jgi:hypothetical protein